jgi:hypothetical protein
MEFRPTNLANHSYLGQGIRPSALILVLIKGIKKMNGNKIQTNAEQE